MLTSCDRASGLVSEKGVFVVFGGGRCDGQCAVLGERLQLWRHFTRHAARQPPVGDDRVVATARLVSLSSEQNAHG